MIKRLMFLLTFGLLVACQARTDPGQLSVVTAGSTHTCGLVSNRIPPGRGRLFCWGDATDSQLGDGTRNSTLTPIRSTVLYDIDPDLVDITSVAAAGTPGIAPGGAHTCVVLAGTLSTVRCWGSNQNGQLGESPLSNPTAFVDVVGIATAKAVAASNANTCAVLSDGTLKCWGDNRFGQLGDGSVSFHPNPVSVTGITNATAVSLGDAFACALLADGSIRCWGRNSRGQLGNGTTTDSATSVVVAGIRNAIDIGAGSDSACAVLSDGTARCWGDNTHGQLGNGMTINSSTPVPVGGLVFVNLDPSGVGYTNVAVGSAFACARRSDGTVRCWGSNNHGQLGNGSIADSSLPVNVSGINKASHVAAAGAFGGADACAALADAAIWCWGGNAKGQLGNGTTRGSITPVRVTGIP